MYGIRVMREATTVCGRWSAWCLNLDGSRIAFGSKDEAKREAAEFNKKHIYAGSYKYSARKIAKQN